MSNVDEALAYAKRGWKVFPIFEPIADGSCSCGKATCGDVGKHPRIGGGFKNATTDAQVISGWWSRWPSANLAIATGEASGLWVLDLDDDEGVSAFGELAAKYGEIPRTPAVRTGGGGRHCYFKWTRKIANASKTGGKPIDVQATAATSSRRHRRIALVAPTPGRSRRTKPPWRSRRPGWSSGCDQRRNQRGGQRGR